jgi:hypothetical protein
MPLIPDAMAQEYKSLGQRCDVCFLRRESHLQLLIKKYRQGFSSMTDGTSDRFGILSIAL